MNEHNENCKNVCNYKVKECLQCGAKTTPDDEKEFFCSQCGAPVLNKCSDYKCQEMLDGNAKFCKHCGSSSIFNNYGLFDKNSPIFSIGNDDLPF